MPLARSIGRHLNDRVVSFYVAGPSGFDVEYGTGGRLIDDATWTVETYHSGSAWGHRPPSGGVLPMGAVHPSPTPR